MALLYSRYVAPEESGSFLDISLREPFLQTKVPDSFTD